MQRSCAANLFGAPAVSSAPAFLPSMLSHCLPASIAEPKCSGGLGLVGAATVILSSSNIPCVPRHLNSSGKYSTDNDQRARYFSATRGHAHPHTVKPVTPSRSPTCCFRSCVAPVGRFVNSIARCRRPPKLHQMPPCSGITPAWLRVLVLPLSLSAVVFLSGTQEPAAN